MSLSDAFAEDNKVLIHGSVEGGPRGGRASVGSVVYDDTKGVHFEVSGAQLEFGFSVDASFTCDGVARVDDV